MSRAEGFAAVPNWMIRDESFDIYDIAVYAALASHTGPGGVRPSQATLAREARCSRRKVIDVLQHLAERGVVQIVRRRRKGGGVGRQGPLTNGYVLTPHGPLDEDDEFEATDLSAHGAHSSATYVHPATDLSAHESNRHISIEEEPVEEEPVKASGLDEKVFALWELWPVPRRSTRKVVAKSLTTALKVSSWQLIHATAVQHSQAWRTWPDSEIRFVPLLSTWLNQERWLGAVPEPRGSGRLSALDTGAAADAILAQEPPRLRALS